MILKSLLDVDFKNRSSKMVGPFQKPIPDDLFELPKHGKKSAASLWLALSALGKSGFLSGCNTLDLSFLHNEGSFFIGINRFSSSTELQAAADRSKRCLPAISTATLQLAC